MGRGAEPAGSGGGGVLKCACFHLPRRSKKKPPPLVTTKLIGSASRRSAADAPAVQSPRVTFLASASLSTWWPSSPSSAASAGPAPAHSIGNAIEPRRSAAAPQRNGLPRASSSSFSHWRRSLSSSRVMPHGDPTAASAHASFSFPALPASVSSSCMSTPKIPHGCQ